jgi:hypothetical protein
MCQSTKDSNTINSLYDGTPIIPIIAQTPTQLNISTDGKCGINSGIQTNQKCKQNECCSGMGWCGTSSDYCSNSFAGAPQTAYHGDR